MTLTSRLALGHQPVGTEQLQRELQLVFGPELDPGADLAALVYQPRIRGAVFETVRPSAVASGAVARRADGRVAMRIPMDHSCLLENEGQAISDSRRSARCQSGRLRHPGIQHIASARHQVENGLRS